MRQRSTVVAVGALAATLVGTGFAATASDATVRASATWGIKQLNAKIHATRRDNASASLTASNALATKMAVARARLAADGATTQRIRVGRLLAMQGFSKMGKGLREWAEFEGLRITDGDAAAIADPIFDRASNDIDAGHDLLVVAAKKLRLPVRPYRYEHP